MPPTPGMNWPSSPMGMGLRGEWVPQLGAIRL